MLRSQVEFLFYEVPEVVCVWVWFGLVYADGACSFGDAVMFAAVALGLVAVWAAWVFSVEGDARSRHLFPL